MTSMSLRATPSPAGDSIAPRVRSRHHTSKLSLCAPALLRAVWEWGALKTSCRPESQQTRTEPNKQHIISASQQIAQAILNPGLLGCIISKHEGFLVHFVEERMLDHLQSSAQHPGLGPKEPLQLQVPCPLPGFPICLGKSWLVCLRLFSCPAAFACCLSSVLFSLHFDAIFDGEPLTELQ